jgi:anti-anti-sigma factor
MSTIKTTQSDDVLVVYFEESKFLDTETIERVGRELLDSTLAAAADKKMVLSFRNVRFMSSSMINKILSLHKLCKKDGIDLRLCSMSDDILQVFKITRLDRLLNIHKDEATAIKSFDKKGWFG